MLVQIDPFIGGYYKYMLSNKKLYNKVFSRRSTVYPLVGKEIKFIMVKFFESYL